MEIKAPNIQMLNDPTGKTSLMRMLVAYIVVVFTTVWAYLSIKDGAMYSIDWEQISIVVLPLFAKAIQAFAENKEDKK